MTAERESPAGIAGAWASQLAAPALIFWGIGTFAWIWTHDRNRILDQINHFLTKANATAPLAITIAVLLAVGVSSVAVQPLALPVMRALEGYWPGGAGPLRRLLVRRQQARWRERRQRWGELAARGADALSPDEVNEFALLDERLARYPVDPALLMPTRLGNVLRAAETRPQDKYGLNTIVCWPRLWLVLSETARAELSAARGRMDGAALVVLWSMLSVVWGIWLPIVVPLAVVIAVAAYHWLLSQAQDYADLYEAAFDVHRRDLYEALGREMPPPGNAEREAGMEITRALWRGA